VRMSTKDLYQQTRGRTICRLRKVAIASAMAVWIDVHLRRIILQRSVAKTMVTIQESYIDKLVKIMSSWLAIAKCSNRIQKLEAIITKLSKRQSLRMVSFCVNHLRLEVCIKKASHRFFSMLLRRRNFKSFSKWDNWQTEKKRTEQIQLNFVVRCSAIEAYSICSQILTSWRAWTNEVHIFVDQNLVDFVHPRDLCCIWVAYTYTLCADIVLCHVAN